METSAKIIAAVTMVALSLPLTGCALPGSGGSTDSVKIPDCVPSGNDQQGATSLVDEAGIEAIRESCQATFEFESGELLKTNVGLALEDYGPRLEFDGLIDLTLIGAQSTIEVQTDRFNLFTTPGYAEISYVTYFLTADNLDELIGLVQEGNNAFGFGQDTVDRWIDYNRNTSDSDRNDTTGKGFVFSSTEDLGFEVSYDTRYKGPGKVSVIIVTVSPRPL